MMTIDVPDPLILTTVMPQTPGQTETYTSPVDIFILPYPQSHLLLGLTFLKDIVTPEEKTTSRRQEHSPCHPLRWSFHLPVLTALLVEWELAFSSEEFEVPGDPSPLCRDVSLDRYSRRSSVHPSPQYDYRRD